MEEAGAAQMRSVFVHPLKLNVKAEILQSHVVHSGTHVEIRESHFCSHTQTNVPLLCIYGQFVHLSLATDG